MYKSRIIAAVLLTSSLCLGVQSQDVPSYALHGTVITPTTVIPNGTIVIVADRIAGVGADVHAPEATTQLETDSFIFPGLVDLHNHLTWNLFPRGPPVNGRPTEWHRTRKFGARYDWQQPQSYKEDLDTPHSALLEEGWGCEMNRYGEVKAIAGGSTSSVGSLGPVKCIEGLARDLDFYSGLYQADNFTSEKLVYNVFPLEMQVNDTDKVRTQLSSGLLNAFIIHVAEGAPGNASAA